MGKGSAIDSRFDDMTSQGSYLLKVGEKEDSSQGSSFQKMDND